VSTIHPTQSLAQQAGIAYDEYREFVYDAVLRDWAALADRMAELKTILDEGSEVRLLTEHDDQPPTDLRMSIRERTAVNSAASVAYDSQNLPSGEVFTTPYDTEGEVFFDVPMTINSRRVRDVHLVFEDGEIVDFEAAQGAGEIESVLATDEGARRLGELGIGMNRGLDRVTDNILFDEKMVDTVHLALGRAYDATPRPASRATSRRTRRSDYRGLRGRPAGDRRPGRPAERSVPVRGGLRRVIPRRATDEWLGGVRCPPFAATTDNKPE
jgi:aminopeptidase